MGEHGMSEVDGRGDPTKMRILRALEAKPEVSIPAGFAARVAGRVPARREAATTPARYGMIAMRIAIAVLVIALVAVSMRAGNLSPIGIAVEWILCAQLVAIALWRSGVWRRGVSEV
jgi:hypothetical protein